MPKIPALLPLRPMISLAILASLVAGALGLERESGSAQAAGENKAVGTADLGGSGKKVSLREASYNYLRKLDSRNAILKIVPQLIADARKPLKDKVNAARLAHDLEYVSKALLFDENEIAAAQVQEIAVGLCPDEVPLKAQLADYLGRAGRPQEADKIFSGADLSDKADGTMIKMLAQYKSRCGDANGGRLLLERFAGREDLKNDPWFQAIRGRTWLKCGLNKRAATILRKAADLESNKYCQHLWLGAAEALASKSTAAENEIEAASKVLPDDPLWRIDMYSITSNKDAKSYQYLVDALSAVRLCSRGFYTNAYYLQSHGQFEQARKCLAYVTRFRPQSSELCFARARLCRAEGKPTEAIAAYEEGFKRNPYACHAYLEESALCTEAKQPEKAFQILLLETKMCPHYLRGWQLLGNEFMLKNNLEEAQKCYLKAVSCAPDNFEEGNILIKNDVGALYARLADIDYRKQKRAEAIVEAARFNHLKLVLDLGAALSVIHLRPGRLEDKIVLQKEKQVREYTLLADALVEAKDYDNAMIEYRKAIALDANDPDLHSYLLNVLTEKGDWGAAAGEDLHLSNSLVQQMPKSIDGFFHPKGKTAN